MNEGFLHHYADPVDTTPDRLKSGWVTLQKDLFPNGSIGQTLFPESLIGRQRPATIFDEPLGAGIAAQTSGPELYTYGDVLKLSADFLNKLPADFQDGLNEYLAGLEITPHARLLMSMDRKLHISHKLYQSALPPEREVEFIELVEAIIDSTDRTGNPILSDEQRAIIRLKYGLSLGYATRPELIGQSLGKSPSRINDIDGKAHDRLATNHRTRLLDYRIFSDVSVGRSLFNFVFANDFAYVDAGISELNLSDDALTQLKRIGITKYDDVFYLLRAPGASLSEATQGEIVTATEKYTARRQQLSSTHKEPVVALDPVESVIPVNNFMPTLPIDPDLLGLIAGQPIHILGLSIGFYNSMRRAGIDTVGNFLRHSEEELLKRRRIGKKTVSELKEKLQLLVEASKNNPI